MNSAACWRPVAFRRRLLLVFLVAAQTLAGVYLFAQTVPEQANGGTTATLLAVFGLLFAWIGVGFWTAVFGFFCAPLWRRPLEPVQPRWAAYARRSNGRTYRRRDARLQ